MAGPLIDAATLAQWMVQRLDEGDGPLVVADVRWYLDGRSGREAYAGGHIPGAVFVDLDTALTAGAGHGPGRHPLPAPGAFARAMEALGIGDGVTVVAYDDAGGSIAARLWWMLDVQDHAALVLDGGLAAWPGPLVKEPSPGESPLPAPPAHFTARPWPAGTLADADAVAAATGAVLDARAPERYRGDVEPVDPRAGHVPGARNAPWAANLDPATGRFLPAAALRARYDEFGPVEIAYCGSGVTACHDLLALRLAGLPPARLYEGSWSDWSADPVRPLATGPNP
ncbi:MAG TPA: sulfurtransferase [Acidimicrobiales bacterium]|nr:sulfurtransferase [Acidimicrobiales bacterium]